MSSTTLSSSYNFQIIFNNALLDYTKQTGVDLTKYDFANRLERCSSSDEVLQLLCDKAKEFKEYRDGNRQLIKWITPVVGVVHRFAGFLGEATSVGSNASPGKAIFAGVDVLLTVAIGVSSSYDALVDLFESVGNFLRRLKIYAEIPLNDEMMDMLRGIMVEVLSVLALATKQIKQGRFTKFAKALFRSGGDIEAILQRLDRRTNDEARMTVTQTLKIVYGLMYNVKLVMDNGNVSTDGIRQALVSMQEKTSVVNKMMRDQLQDRVRNWLSAPNPSTNQNAIYENYQAGTASWFFQGNIFAKWKATGPILWISGKLGSGKSTLISSIIHGLYDKRATGLASVVYYYFDSESRDASKQKLRGLLSSLLVQLASESDPCYEILSRLYKTHAYGAQEPSNVELINCLKNMLQVGQHPSRQATYIIIDAIDECPNTSGIQTPRKKVLEFLKVLINWRLPHLRICVASRPEVDIRNTLEPLKPLQVSLHEESGQRKDILDYITKVVEPMKWREEDKLLAIRILPEKSDGMFQWAFCQLESLSRCTSSSIRHAIYSSPKDLDKTYVKILRNIDAEKQECAQLIFQCLAVSIHPLQLDDLAEILAIRFNSDSMPNYNTGRRSGEAKADLLSACSSLITVANVNGSQVVQFSHSSVKEFLTSGRLPTMGSGFSLHHILPGPAHTVMAKACLSNLVKLDDSVDRDTIKISPLAHYAARHWIEHAQFDDVSSHVQDIMFRLFDSDKPHFRTWIWLYDPDRHWGNTMSTPHPTQPQASPLYYATLCGFYGLVEHLVRTRRSDINARGGYYVTPLHASLRGRGHEKITRLLLEEGANVDDRDYENATPLHRACRAGNLFVVKLLLNHNADIHAQTGNQELPLHIAAGRGDVDICRLLIEYDADVNRNDDQGQNPLHTAARYGHLEVVKILLGRGVDVNTKKKDRWTPLHLASANGKSKVVDLLIQNHAIIDIRNENEETPLDRAAANGHLEIAQRLLDSSANVNAIDKQSWTPLHRAARNGYPEVVQLLIGSGADIHAQTKSGKTPLAMACGRGEIEVARILIPVSNLNTADKDGWTPLHYAVRYGHFDVAQLLLNNDAHVNAGKGDCWTPIHLAAANGHLDIAKLLIDRRAVIDSRNTKLQTPLDRAAGHGFLDISRLLVESGAKVFAQDSKGWTTLHRASKYGHLHVAKFLLESGVPVDIRNENEETSLYLASGCGKLDVVHFLIKNGADIQAVDSNGWNSIHIASQNGHVDVVRLLILAGVPVDLRNGAQMTPLALASGKGKVEVGRFLIGQGADLYARDNQNWIPLHFASRRGHTDVARLLLDSDERRATIDILNDRQETPLHRAAGNEKADVARLLIDHGAKVNVVDNGGWTPLHTASHGGHLDVVKLLLRRGADVDARNKIEQNAEDMASKNNKPEVAKFLAEYKSNPDVRYKIRSVTLELAQIQIVAGEEGKDEKNTLHIAAEEGKVDLVRSFLDKGEGVDSKNAYNQTPLHIAATKGNLDVVRLLIERGAKVELRDNFGWTPLHEAARYGHLPVSRELIKRRANVNARKQDLCTPMHLSARNGHLGLVKLLLECDADVRIEDDEGRTPYQLSITKGHQKIVDLFRDYERGKYDA